MSEEVITIQWPAKFRWSWVFRVVLWTLVVLFFSAMTGCTLMIETPVHFLAGWLIHGVKTLPPLLSNWHGLVLPAGCLGLAGVLIHRFVSRCLNARDLPLTWRPANTVAIMTLLLLGCGAAIALSGVVHQTVWLMGDRWVEDRGKRAELTVAVSNARQLMLALGEFHELKGHYPNSFRELETELGTPPQLAWVKTGYGRVREPFILLRPGATRQANANEPLIVSPVIQNTGKFAVGYGDTSVRSHLASQLEKILQAREPEQPPPPLPE